MVLPQHNFRLLDGKRQPINWRKGCLNMPCFVVIWKSGFRQTIRRNGRFSFYSLPSLNLCPLTLNLGLSPHLQNDPFSWNLIPQTTNLLSISRQHCQQPCSILTQKRGTMPLHTRVLPHDWTRRENNGFEGSSVIACQDSRGGVKHVVVEWGGRVRGRVRATELRLCLFWARVDL